MNRICIPVFDNKFYWYERHNQTRNFSQKLPLSPSPARPLIEKVYFNTDTLNSKPIYFICAAQDKAIPYSLQKKMTEANGHIKKVFPLNLSHVMPFVQVTEVVEILNGLRCSAYKNDP